MQCSHAVGRSGSARRAAIVRLVIGAVCWWVGSSLHGQVVQYHGGPTMQGPISVFLIFWEPSQPTPLFYDSSTGTSDATYRSLMSRFFRDVAPSSYFNILTQYFGACESNSSNSCVVPNASGTVTIPGNGVFVDPRPYPHAGTTADPLQDSDVRDEINKAITVNGWTVSNNSEFFVFTTAGINECADFGCTFLSSKGPAFCAYHDSADSVIYAFVADIGCVTPSPAPNLVSADGTVVVMSHEFFESVSDPFPNGATAWGGAGEIGDSCVGVLGPTQADGSNVQINGDDYDVQEIFSNDTLLCVIGFGPTLQLTANTGNDDLRYDSAVTATLAGTAGPFQGVPFKTTTQSTWGDRTSQVRVFGINQTTMNSIGLAMSPGGPGNDDEWKLASLDVRILDPLGNLICDQSLTASPGPLADLKLSSPTISFPTPNCAGGSVPAWDSVEIEIRTGNDDARSDSEVTAMIAGQTMPLCLKPSTNSGLFGDPICTQNSSSATDQQGNNTWNTFTNSDQTFPLSPTETATSAFSTMTVTLVNSDPSCGNFGHQGCDNWDVEGIQVTVFNSKGGPPARTVLATIGNMTGGSSDDCLARLKAPKNNNATAATFGLDGTGSHVYANGKETGTTTGCKNNGDNP
jgi:hypothetical protein